MDPLLVTARLDATTQGWLEQLRREHFPADRLQVGAHLMLFHALPDEPWVAADVAAACARAPVEASVSRLRALGRGVAYELSAPALHRVRDGLAARWAPHLSSQDRQRWAPHVTVQNKVTPQRARVTYEALAAGFAPQPATVVGLEVWVYRGGPWESRAFAPFRG